MDVHKNSYSLCAIYGKTGEILGETKISSDIKLIEKFINNQKRKSMKMLMFWLAMRLGV